MPQSAEQLVVRQHERFHCRLPLQLRVAPEMAEQIVLARAVCDGSGSIEAFITDASRGGLGIESAVFLPRGCRLRVRLKDGGPTDTIANELVVRVQRVSMLDRKPTYYLGVSFFSKGIEHDATVAAMLEAARAGQQVVGTPGPTPTTPKTVPTPPHAAPGKGGS